MQHLKQVVASMHRAAQEAGVAVVTGDTKVVDKGKGDSIFINTTGVGIIEHRVAIKPSSIAKGDAILINGDLGRHGVAIMAVREGLAFETTIESDSASLASLIKQLLDARIEIHCLRDLTRGGLATALVELAEGAQVAMHIKESAIPVREDVRGACELLGLDPLYVANEGRCVLFVAAQDAERALSLMRGHPQGQGSAHIGTVAGSHPRWVTLSGALGTERLLDMLSGEQLPRIC